MAKNKFGEKKALRKRALFFVQRDAARAEHIDASFAVVVVLGKKAERLAAIVARRRRRRRRRRLLRQKDF